MNFNWLEILLAIGGTSGITTILTLQIQRRKGKAEAGQEEAKAHQEDVKAKKDLADLERDIYTRIVQTMNTEFDSQNQKIKSQNEEITAQKKAITSLEDTQKDLLVTIKLQDDNIKQLQSVVTDYKETCDNCQIRIDKKMQRK